MEVKIKLIEAHIVRQVENKVEFLLLKRSPNQLYPNIWQMVTGKIRENEKAYETAVREIKEETNLSIKNLFVVPNVNPFYNSLENSMNLVPVFVTIVSDESLIVLSDEHHKYKWVDKKEAKNKLAWPGQFYSVDLINRYLSKKSKNLNFIEINIWLLLWTVLFIKKNIFS